MTEYINKVIDDILVEVVESARWNPNSDMLKVIPGFRKALLKRLDSQGVVRKVDEFSNLLIHDPIRGFIKVCEVEPLIGEE